MVWPMWMWTVFVILSLTLENTNGRNLPSADENLSFENPTTKSLLIMQHTNTHPPQQCSLPNLLKQLREEMNMMSASSEATYKQDLFHLLDDIKSYLNSHDENVYMKLIQFEAPNTDTMLLFKNHLANLLSYCTKISFFAVNQILMQRSDNFIMKWINALLYPNNILGPNTMPIPVIFRKLLAEYIAEVLSVPEDQIIQHLYKQSNYYVLHMFEQLLGPSSMSLLTITENCYEQNPLMYQIPQYADKMAVGSYMLPQQYYAQGSTGPIADQTQLYMHQPGFFYQEPVVNALPEQNEISEVIQEPEIMTTMPIVTDNGSSDIDIDIIHAPEQQDLHEISEPVTMPDGELIHNEIIPEQMGEIYHNTENMNIDQYIPVPEQPQYIEKPHMFSEEPTIIQEQENLEQPEIVDIIQPEREPVFEQQQEPQLIQNELLQNNEYIPENVYIPEEQEFVKPSLITQEQIKLEEPERVQMIPEEPEEIFVEHEPEQEFPSQNEQIEPMYNKYNEIKPDEPEIMQMRQPEMEPVLPEQNLQELLQNDLVQLRSVEFELNNDIVEPEYIPEEPMFEEAPTIVEDQVQFEEPERVQIMQPEQVFVEQHEPEIVQDQLMQMVVTPETTIDSMNAPFDNNIVENEYIPEEPAFVEPTFEQEQVNQEQPDIVQIVPTETEQVFVEQEPVLQNEIGQIIPETTVVQEMPMESIEVTEQSNDIVEVPHIPDSPIIVPEQIMQNEPISVQEIPTEIKRVDVQQPTIGTKRPIPQNMLQALSNHDENEVMKVIYDVLQFDSIPAASNELSSSCREIFIDCYKFVMTPANKLKLSRIIQILTGKITVSEPDIYEFLMQFKGTQAIPAIYKLLDHSHSSSEYFTSSTEDQIYMLKKQLAQVLSLITNIPIDTIYNLLLQTDSYQIPNLISQIMILSNKKQFINQNSFQSLISSCDLLNSLKQMFPEVNIEYLNNLIIRTISKFLNQLSINSSIASEELNLSYNPTDLYGGSPRLMSLLNLVNTQNIPPRPIQGYNFLNNFSSNKMFNPSTSMMQDNLLKLIYGN